MGRAAGQESLIIDDLAVTHSFADGKSERVAWEDLAEVVIRTTADGPLEEDVFFLLIGRSGATAVVPQVLADELLVRLQGLPAFDNEAVVRAMASTEAADFVCWRAPGAPAPEKAG